MKNYEPAKKTSDTRDIRVLAARLALFNSNRKRRNNALDLFCDNRNKIKKSI